ncbi:MAG TPA: SRPBCC family protein [Actinomycetota bacterium]
MKEPTTMEPVRVAVTVLTRPDDAFRLYTERIADWWPLETHSLFGRDATRAVFEGREGGRIYEVHRDGRESEWGRVLVWDPPARVVHSWQPNPERSGTTEVEVRFHEVDGGTRVELEHRGWERLGDEAEALRGEYEGGWVTVLDAYERAAG